MDAKILPDCSCSNPSCCSARISARLFLLAVCFSMVVALFISLFEIPNKSILSVLVPIPKANKGLPNLVPQANVHYFDQGLHVPILISPLGRLDVAVLGRSEQLTGFGRVIKVAS
ncbi:hypothetical protein L1987_02831 [Smallanthus sonchifolius]|uniref:Uncharacterized protein n=1 Tax=Smallanthus sonchifolius TaxID=185202 RepID=A0ACB9K8V2_9ASTR|nr:hypothetical protein L1987_02831 [Smallanthus sonchifolius]